MHVEYLPTARHSVQAEKQCSPLSTAPSFVLIVHSRPNRDDTPAQVIMVLNGITGKHFVNSVMQR